MLFHIMIWFILQFRSITTVQSFWGEHYQNKTRYKYTSVCQHHVTKIYLFFVGAKLFSLMKNNIFITMVELETQNNIHHL